MRRPAFVPTIAAAIIAFAAASASAQHARYVLFGEGAIPESPAEHRFVHPVTAPYYAEDSFVTSDVRPWFVYHDFPNDDLIDGGKAKVYALQLRLALTDQLQLVAYKDGYVDFDSGLVSESGWNDLAAGLKWNFLQDWQNQFHMAAGAGYEFPVGDPSVLQNDAELRLWYSINKGFGPLHLGGTVNYLLAVGDDDGDALGSSDVLTWHLHADYYINRYVSPIIEANGYHVMNGGAETVPFSGVDVANLAGGGDVITIGVGVEVRPVENIGVRAAYELPLTDDEDDLFGSRFTFSMVFSF